MTASYPIMAELQNMLHRIAVPQLWLGVFLCLSGWPQIGQTHYESSLEVVIPTKIAGTNRGTKTPEWLSYILHFGGQRHIVHMKVKKILISRSFSVITYTNEGALLEEWPYVQSDCYYQGYIEGTETSMVSINACFGGFQGTLQVNDTQYEIKPKSPSNSFEHLVYKMDEEAEKSHSMRCALTDEEIDKHLKLQDNENFMGRQSAYEGWFTHKAFLEIALIVDNQRYNYRKSNITHVLHDVFIIVNIISSIFSSLDVDVHLLAVEIWTIKNLALGANTAVLLDNFCDWKVADFGRRIKSDVTHLLIHQYFGMYLGKAYVGGVCGTWSCGVIRCLGEDMFFVAQTTAHEMCHNLGMPHDGSDCTCGGKECIMAPHHNLSLKFSNCSYATLVTTYRSKSCLRLPANEEQLFRFQLCGDGAVDDGEECDCGTIQLCEENPCCHTNCTLTSGAECAHGLCCKDCLLLPSTTLCRGQETDCDLPEFCNGTSPECPEDVFMLDGSSCMGTGYCFDNRCNDRDEQCQNIFGENARNANKTCYEHINIRGDRSGNCGIESHRYKPCLRADILCGRVLCDNVPEIPIFEDHRNVHWSRFNDINCWGTDYHWGMSIPDLGEIRDGTECGEELMCFQRKCIPKPLWANECSPAYCNLNGICNNKNHCHCNYGWNPPFCDVPGGFGGSIDSGPPPGTKTPPSKKAGRNYYLIPIFILSFFIVLITLSIVYLKKENII
ncbi:disintegrin and metalloproteinase domain-containing protein 25-like isoform 1-T6 [Thomomys bottae]